MKSQTRVSTQTIGSVLLVRFIDSKLVEQIDELRTSLLELIEPKQKMIISFQGVDVISGPVLDLLLSCKNTIATLGGGLRLCAMSPVIREVFRITQLHKAFEICDDEKVAIEAFCD